jgi:hypothetical protein
MTNEKLLHWWAILALVLIGTVYVLPRSTLEMLVARPETSIFIRIAVAGVLLVVVLGFFLKMFIECAFSKGVYRRGAWLLLLIFVPIFSAFVYYFVTRSTGYRAHVRRVHPRGVS